MATVEDEIPRANMLEVKTVQTGAFKTLVEALKELLSDTVIEFDPDGIMICTTDNPGIIIAHMRLQASKFEKYVCTRPSIKAGVNMLVLHKIIRAARAGDTLCISMHENDMCNLNISFENHEKNTISTYSLKLLDMDAETLTIPPEDFPAVLSLSSVDFQKICRDMHNIAEKAEICSVGNKLIFRCVGDFCSHMTTMTDASMDPNSPQVKGTFSLKYLTLFTKCTNLCNNVLLYLKHDYPLIVRYAVTSLGSIQLCLCPQDEEDA